MKVGDYVRTTSGIERLKKENDNGWFFEKSMIIKPDNIEKYIIKSRPNIIDLVEVGDILVIKDFVDEACMIFTDIYLIQNEQQLLNVKNDLEKNKNKKLYSIITKEQFSCMEYKIGE